MRNSTSLIQTSGRASRNENGSVIMYANNITKSMKAAIAETDRRKEKQIKYNKEHKITPKTIIKSIPDGSVYRVEKSFGTPVVIGKGEGFAFTENTKLQDAAVAVRNVHLALQAAAEQASAGK